MKNSRLSLFVRSYWDYYLELEDQFRNTQRYVAFDKSNHNTYSLQYLQLMQAVCGEIDVAAKEIASKINPEFRIDNKTNIQKWGIVLQRQFPQILKRKVIFNHNFEVTPWDKWLYKEYKDKGGKKRIKLVDGTRTPPWWQANNDVKHARTRSVDDGKVNYAKANLGNVIQCFAALFILETEYMRTLSEDQEPIRGIGESQLYQDYYEGFDDLIY